MSHTNPTDHSEGPSLDRRRWLRRAAAAGLLAALPGCARRLPEPPADGEMLRFPGKVPMRALNDSPPNLETPWRFYRDDLTPNDAFFVRWHLQFIPTTVDLRTWRLKVGGHVERPLELSMDELRRMAATSLVAVNQCSGNSRGLFEPRVPGGQWGNGAMGNARWTGVPLRDLLRRAGVRDGAIDVTFAGLDRSGYADRVRFRQVAARGPGDRPRRRHPGGLRDERQAAAAAQRLPGAAGGARLVRHLLGQGAAAKSPSCRTASTASG